MYMQCNQLLTDVDLVFFSQMKDVPKLGGPDSLFYRAGLEAGSGFPPRLSLTSSVASTQFPTSGQPQSASQQTKVSLKWERLTLIFILLPLFRRPVNGMQCM